MSESSKSAPKTLLAYIVSPVMIVDKTDRIIYLNPAGQQTFERVLADVLGNGLDSLAAEKQAVDLTGGLTLLREGADRADVQFELKGRWFNATMSPIRKKDGQYAGAVIHVVEVTAEREHQQMKNDLLAAVVNDVLAPLRYATSLLREIQPIMEAPDEERIRLIGRGDWDRKIKESANALDNARLRLTGLVEMGRSNAEVETDLLLKTTVRPFQLINGAVQAVMTFSEEHQIEVKRVTDNPNFQLICDSEQINFVLVNLISFCLHQTVRGGMVTVGAFSHAKRNGVWITLAYHGNEMGEHATQQFLTGQSDSAKHFQIPRIEQIIQAHQGRLHMECVPSSGTAFTLWLPSDSA